MSIARNVQAGCYAEERAMTPEERRKRVEYVVKMAKLGILAEPAYDREERGAQQEKDSLPLIESPKASRRALKPRRAARRRTA